MSSSWHARLSLDYTASAGRTAARFAHDGPLRVLQTLHPEGPGIAHNVLVHPPGGLVGGDELEIDVHAGAGAHGLVTTPGAARFYRSEGAAAVQRTRISVDAGARMEWLPLEAICYPGCIARNELRIALAPGGEAMAWDLVALGLPAAGQAFGSGSLLQHLEVEGHWLDRGRIDALDARLMDGPLGLAGHRCLASLVFATGEPLTRARRDQALELAREAISAQRLEAGATSPSPHVVVVRVLAPLVEPAVALLRAVRAAWRPALWALAPTQPRTWAL